MSMFKKIKFKSNKFDSRNRLAYLELILEALWLEYKCVHRQNKNIFLAEYNIKHGNHGNVMLKNPPSKIHIAFALISLNCKHLIDNSLFRHLD